MHTGLGLLTRPRSLYSRTQQPQPSLLQDTALLCLIYSPGSETSPGTDLPQESKQADYAAGPRVSERHSIERSVDTKSSPLVSWSRAKEPKGYERPGSS